MLREWCLIWKEISCLKSFKGSLMIILLVLDDTKNSAGIFPSTGVTQRHELCVNTFTPLVCCAERSKNTYVEV